MVIIVATMGRHQGCQGYKYVVMKTTFWLLNVSEKVGVIKVLTLKAFDNHDCQRLPW